MGLDGLARLVLDVVDTDLDGPLRDSAGGVAIADDVLQRCRGYDRDAVLLEVLWESTLGVEDSVHHLSLLGVSLPRLGEDLGKVIDRELHGAFPSFF